MVMNDIKIKQMSRKKLHKIINKSIQELNWKCEINIYNGIFLDNDLIGFCTFSNDQTSIGEVITLHHFYIDPSFRKNGYASEVLKKILLKLERPFLSIDSPNEDFLKILINNNYLFKFLDSNCYGVAESCSINFCTNIMGAFCLDDSIFMATPFCWISEDGSSFLIYKINEGYVLIPTNTIKQNNFSKDTMSYYNNEFYNMLKSSLITNSILSLSPPISIVDINFLKMFDVFVPNVDEKLSRQELLSVFIDMMEEPIDIFNDGGGDGE